MLAELTAAGAALSVALDYLQEFILRAGDGERFERPREGALDVRGGGAQRVHRFGGTRRRWQVFGCQFNSSSGTHVLFYLLKQ